VSDLLERLRAAHQDRVQRCLGSSIFKEAADEIVRLGEIVSEYARSDAEKGCRLVHVAAKYAQERDEWKKYADDGLRSYAEQQAEIASLSSRLDGRQKRVYEWVLRSFGPGALNRDERAARLAEESVEVAQAEGVPLDAMLRIVERVYSRPVGEIGREIGGVAITLDALAENLGRSVSADAETELARVLSKPAEHWRMKHAEKVAAGTANLSPVVEKQLLNSGEGN
jgi:predicted metalloendopeptidase